MLLRTFCNAPFHVQRASRIPLHKHHKFPHKHDKIMQHALHQFPSVELMRSTLQRIRGQVQYTLQAWQCLFHLNIQLRSDHILSRMLCMHRYNFDIFRDS
jgi:hypothetical protein